MSHCNSITEEASINSEVVESDQFSMPLVALFPVPLEIRPKLSQKLMTELFSMDFLCGYNFYADHSGGP